MPSSGQINIPRGFSPPREQPPSPSSDPLDNPEADLAAATAAAHREWEEIRRAFDVFRSRLGPDFEPMSAEYSFPEMTPFGPALMYRTYSIAGIWMNYYMGMIILHRSHPAMPPLALVAAGMAAQQTAQYANEVARIAAGLYEDTTGLQEIPTTVAAAFLESGFCLFVAGVQVSIFFSFLFFSFLFFSFLLFFSFPFPFPFPFPFLFFSPLFLFSFFFF